MLPQYYTVHCIVTGGSNGATVKQYYNDDTDVELNQTNCGGQYDGYSCTLTNKTIHTNYTYSSTRDYRIRVEWDAIEIGSGIFSQSKNNGDHEFLCTVANGAIEATHKG